MAENEITLNMPWIKEMKRLLGEKFTVINKFSIDTEKLKKEFNTLRTHNGEQNLGRRPT